MDDISRRRAQEDAIRAIAREKLKSQSQRRTARELGVSRDALRALAEGAHVRPGTFALVRERIASQAPNANAASPGPAAAL